MGVNSQRYEIRTSRGGFSRQEQEGGMMMMRMMTVPRQVGPRPRAGIQAAGRQALSPVEACMHACMQASKPSAPGKQQAGRQAQTDRPSASTHMKLCFCEPASG